MAVLGPYGFKGTLYLPGLYMFVFIDRFAYYTVVLRLLRHLLVSLLAVCDLALNCHYKDPFHSKVHAVTSMLDILLGHCLIYVDTLVAVLPSLYQSYSHASNRMQSFASMFLCILSTLP